MSGKLKIFSAALFSFFILLFTSFSADAVSKALDLLNKSIILNDTEKAYSYAKFIISYYDGNDIPDDTMTSVKDAVSLHTKKLEEAENWTALLEVEEELSEAPSEVKRAAQSSINKAKKYFEELEKQKEAKKKEEENIIAQLKYAQDDKKTEELINKLADQIEKANIMIIQQNKENELRMEKRELKQAEQYAENKAREDEKLNRIIQSNNTTISSVSSDNKMIVFGFSFLIIIFIGVIVFIVITTLKQQNKNQEQMKNTIITMQAMRYANPAMEALPLSLKLENGGALPEKKSLLIEDNSSGEGNSAGDETLALLKVCKEYGQQIDAATGRKNVSSRVAELVYKISIKLNYPENEALLYYAAGLVYDIGFLNIDTNILKAEAITETQFELFKTHTTIGPNMVFFVDEQHRELFKDATGKHHENLDGTGYPSGLKGKEIPYIARVLRVVESYIALVSSRQYAEIRDRNSAVSELKSMPNFYDEEIVEALDSIV